MLPPEISTVLPSQRFQIPSIELKFLGFINKHMIISDPEEKHCKSPGRTYRLNLVIFWITFDRKWTKEGVAGRNFYDFGFFRCTSECEVLKSGFKIFIR